MPCAKCSSRASELPYEQKKFFLVVCPIHAPEKIKRYNPVYSASPAKKSDGNTFKKNLLLPSNKLSESWNFKDR